MPPSDPEPPTSDRLILQIFPRSDPGRAISYSGDQDYIRGILRDVARRVEEGAEGPPLRLLGERGDDS